MAREIIKVNVKVGRVDALKVRSDLLAVGVFSEGRDGALCKDLDKKLGGAIAKVRQLGDFKGKVGTTALLYGNEEIGARRVLLVGLGERKKVAADGLRHRSHLVVGLSDRSCHFYRRLSDQSAYRRLGFYLISHCRRQYS